MIQRDVDDGHSTVWAEAVANGDRINSKNDNVHHILMYTPATERETELDKLIDRWVKAKRSDDSIVVPHREITNEDIIDKLDDKVPQRVGKETGFTNIKTTNNDSTQSINQIDPSKVAPEIQNERDHANETSDQIDVGIAVPNNNSGYTTPPPPPWKRSPSDQGLGDSGGSGHGGFNNLNMGGNGPEELNDNEPTHRDRINRQRNGDEDRSDKEFRRVNPRNINVSVFNGKNLVTNPYMAFNTSIRRLMLTQGDEGELLRKIFDYVETLGARKLTNTHLANLQNNATKQGSLTGQ